MPLTVAASPDRLSGMGIGTGIFLLVVGAVLAFGVRDGIDAVDLTAVGWICMAGGALAIAIALLVTRRRRVGAASTTYVERHDEVPPAV